MFRLLFVKCNYLCCLSHTANLWEILQMRCYERYKKETDGPNISPSAIKSVLVCLQSNSQPAGCRVGVPEWRLRSGGWERSQASQCPVYADNWGWADWARERDRATRLILTNIILICSRGEICQPGCLAWIITILGEIRQTISYY